MISDWRPRAVFCVRTTGKQNHLVGQLRGCGMRARMLRSGSGAGINWAVGQGTGNSTVRRHLASRRPGARREACFYAGEQ